MIYYPTLAVGVVATVAALLTPDVTPQLTDEVAVPLTKPALLRRERAEQSQYGNGEA